MNLAAEYQAVFDVFSAIFECIPNTLRLLCLAAFGSVCFIAFVRSIRR